MPKKSQTALKLALVGAGGRMGAEIQKLAATGLAKVEFKIDSAADWKGVDAKRVDIVIDFSSPEGLGKALAWCLKHGKPLVSGSTGLAPKDFAALKATARKIPVLYSGNMSLGVAVLSAMLDRLGAVADWDFQIEEAHHNQKKDRPSGTALLLQQKLENVLKTKLPEPHSLRGGGIPGIHTVWAMGPEETLVLQHTALNRRVFARGALSAARWLFDKKQPGLYDLSHLYSVK